MENFNLAYTTAPSSISGRRYRPQIKSEKEANYVQSRAAVSRARDIDITITWDKIPSSELATIVTFLDTNQGTVFNWTDPKSTLRTVRFSYDSIDWKWLVEPDGYCTVTVVLEET